MNFMRRDLICERLCLNVRQSYRLIGSSRSGLISSDEVVRILNRSRRGIAEPFDYIPSDIATPDEILLEVDGIMPNQLRAWLRRTRNVCPHFRLNGHTRRIPRAIFLRWLSSNSKVERRS